MNSNISVLVSSDEEDSCVVIKEVTPDDPLKIESPVQKYYLPAPTINTVTLNDEGDDEEYQLDLHTKTKSELEKQKLILPKPLLQSSSELSSTVNNKKKTTKKVKSKNVSEITVDGRQSEHSKLPKLVPIVKEVTEVVSNKALEQIKSNMILPSSVTITPVSRKHPDSNSHANEKVSIPVPCIKVKDIDKLKSTNDSHSNTNSLLEINQSTNLFILNSNTSQKMLQNVQYVCLTPTKTVARNVINLSETTITPTQKPPPPLQKIITGKAEPVFQISNVQSLASDDKSIPKRGRKRKNSENSVQQTTKKHLNKNINKSNIKPLEVISLDDDEDTQPSEVDSTKQLENGNKKTIEIINVDSDENENINSTKVDPTKETEVPKGDYNSAVIEEAEYDDVVCIESAIDKVDLSSSDSDNENKNCDNTNSNEPQSWKLIVCTADNSDKDKKDENSKAKTGVDNCNSINIEETLQPENNNEKDNKKTNEVINEAVLENDNQNKDKLQHEINKNVEILVEDLPENNLDSSKVNVNTEEHNQSEEDVEYVDTNHSEHINKEAVVDLNLTNSNELKNSSDNVPITSNEVLDDDFEKVGDNSVSSEDIQSNSEDKELTLNKTDSETKTREDVIDNLFKQFLNLCVSENIPIKYRKIRDEHIVKIRKRYEKTNVDFINSKDFLIFLTLKMKELELKPINCAIVFSEVLTKLKNNQLEDSESKKIDREKWRQIKLLEKVLHKLQNKIRALENTEMSINQDWDDNSVYMQEERYKKKCSQVYKKLCELCGENPNSDRPTCMKINFLESKYAEINHAISKLYNRQFQFPNIHDIDKCVKKCVKKHNLKLTDNELQLEVVNCFKGLGKKLQKRRNKEFIRNLYSYGTKEDINKNPADEDTSLDNELRKNQREGQTKIQELINKYANKQEMGEDTISDKEVKDTSDDDSSGDDDVEENGC